MLATSTKQPCNFLSLVLSPFALGLLFWLCHRARVRAGAHVQVLPRAFGKNGNYMFSLILFLLHSPLLLSFLVCFYIYFYATNVIRLTDCNHRGSLSKAQRLDYINAVQCMLQSPPLLDQTQYPGVKNRMDDFVA